MAWGNGYVQAAALASEQKRTISTYKTYYYCGGQAEIYLNDVLIDELNSLMFNTITNRSPIYGYASQLFDTVVKGNLIIHGTLTVNFIEAGYLNIIAQHLWDRSAPPNDLGISLRDSDLDTSTEFRARQTINQIHQLGNKEFKKLATDLNKKQNGSHQVTRFDKIPPFDIYAVFGNHRDPDANHTVKHIKGVYLTGESMVVEASGQPIMEQYSFIAHDIV